MEISQLQARIDEIRWYHEFDFGNGLRAQSNTPNIEVHRTIWRFIAEGLETVDFRDKTVLDVGCWDGYWSFYAERRGAKRVLATDDFTQNWSSAEGLLLAKELLGSRVQTETRTSVYNLASLNQKFDVILCLGVYYHLIDPFYAFAQVRHCCYPGTVVCIEGNESVGLPDNTAGLDLVQGGGKFLPTTGYLHQLLRAAYLSPLVERFIGPDRSEPPSLTWQWRWGLIRRALFKSQTAIRKVAEAMIAPAARQSKAVRRTFLKCSAFEGENSLHLYPPPFGLHVYDPRFTNQKNSDES